MRLLALCLFSCYIYNMTITQTIDIPTDRRLVIDVPHEIPAGKTIIAFTPVDESSVDDCPICAQNRDPETGNPRFNAKALAAMEEARAMARGEIPANWHKPHEFKQVWKELVED